MGDAPYMKSLPGDVKEAREDVAKFGSRMTEMESQLSTVQSSLAELKQQVHQSAEVRKRQQPRDIMKRVDREAGGSKGGSRAGRNWYSLSLRYYCLFLLFYI